MENKADIIFKYFPNLSPSQQECFNKLYSLYLDWNSKINVISRKDIDNFYLHHVLHSLAIAKFINFKDGSKILDVGTGGGFPGIPLAIIFNNSNFTLCDSIGKKLKVANSVADSIGLTNLDFKHIRAEEIKESFDYIVSRAVTDLSNFLPWVKGKYKSGIIYLKGGDLQEEISKASLHNKIKEENILIKDINEWFKEDFFNEKKLIFIKHFAN
jgi:16S rRNA (guanine(527)-N(7))-methyltransferase GidB